MQKAAAEDARFGGHFTQIVTFSAVFDDVTVTKSIPPLGQKRQRRSQCCDLRVLPHLL
jgi:hypothetical protein